MVNHMRKSKTKKQNSRIKTKHERHPALLITVPDTFVPLRIPDHDPTSLLIWPLCVRPLAEVCQHLKSQLPIQELAVRTGCQAHNNPFALRPLHGFHHQHPTNSPALIFRVDHQTVGVPPIRPLRVGLPMLQIVLISPFPHKIQGCLIECMRRMYKEVDLVVHPKDPGHDIHPHPQQHSLRCHELLRSSIIPQPHELSVSHRHIRIWRLACDEEEAVRQAYAPPHQLAEETWHVIRELWSMRGNEAVYRGQPVRSGGYLGERRNVG